MDRPASTAGPDRPSRGLALGRSRARAERRAATDWLDVLFVPALIVIVATYLALSSPFFLTQGNLTNILLQGATLACVACGATFVVLAGELDLSVGSGAALCSVVGAMVMRDADSVLLGALVGIAVGAAIGAINGLVVTKLQVPAFIVTLAMLVVARGLALSLTDGGVVTVPSSVGKLATNNVLGVPIIVWLVFVVLVAALYFLQTQTAFGTRVFATGGNREAARLAGVRTDRIRLLCFVICGVTIGIAGLILTARVQSGQPNAATQLELFAIAAIVLGGTSLYGGRGSVLKTLWGVLFLVVLQNGLDLEGVTADLQSVVIGVVLILASSVDFVRNRLAGLRRRGEQPLA